MILAIALLETPSSMHWRISSSFPSRRDTPSDPFGRPSVLPEALAFARPSRVRSEIRSHSTSANSANSVVMTLVWISRLPSTRMFSLIGDERDARLCEAVKDGGEQAERAPEPGKFAHDKAVAALENTDQFIKPTALCRGLSPCCCLDEVVDLEAVFAGIFENGVALASCILLWG